MTAELVTQHNGTAPRMAAALERVVVEGDLGQLTPELRVEYFKSVCESLGLNPLTQPFAYIRLNGKLVLYAKRDATDQLRSNRHVSVVITARERLDDVYVVTARATLPDGRNDESIGAVAIGGLKGEALANAFMKAECVPLDSEILTRDGFKTYDQVAIGEEVLAYDSATDYCRWTPLLDITTHSNREVIRLHSEGGQFEAYCTPEHSWAVNIATGRGRTRRWVQGLRAANVLRTNHRIILAREAETMGPSLLRPVEAAVLGWAVTDGTIKRVGNSVRIGICQSKEENLPGLRALVNAVAEGTPEHVSPARTRTFPTGRTYDTKPEHWWYIPAAVSRAILDRCGYHDREDLPRIVTRLDFASRMAMLNAMMLAEADDRHNFYNGDPHVIEAFQILCALLGKATSSPHPHLTVTRIRAKRTTHVAASFLQTSPAGHMNVWCPTTHFGTWVMRQNGRVMITGNTKAKRRVTLSVCGLGLSDETEVETIPGAQRVADVSEPPPALPPPGFEWPTEIVALTPQLFQDLCAEKLELTAADLRAKFPSSVNRYLKTHHITLGQLYTALVDEIHNDGPAIPAQSVEA